LGFDSQSDDQTSEAWVGEQTLQRLKLGDEGGGGVCIIREFKRRNGDSGQCVE
jgi:hypothetical protein